MQPQVDGDALIVGPDATDPAAITTTPGELAKPRTRARPQPISLDESGRAEVVRRVVNFWTDDRRMREQDIELRKQRYAKLMQFEPPMSDIEGASNVQLSDMMAVTLRAEDQIQNSVMSTRPIMNARATQDVNKDRERKVDLLLDHQFFVEQDGERLIEQLTANFFRDGHFTALTHWVREFRHILYIRTWAPIPHGVDPSRWFRAILKQAFGQGAYREIEDSDGWDWDVVDGKMELRVRFFTDSEDESVIMEVSGEPIVFEGPSTLSYDYEDVLAPLWAQNLQPPGPSNPHGAPHVLLVDYPTKDEILRGIEHGFYDLADPADLEGVEGFRDWTDGDRDLAMQRHDLRGLGPTPSQGGTEDRSHRQLRRILCFDIWKGLDVVWWVLQGPDILLRARPLTEMCPGLKPVRPISHTVCVTVQGTWLGMGLPELMESTHDFQVAVFNQMVDAASLEIMPWFKYRQSSNLKPEDIVLGPGKGIPMQNPQTDLIVERIQAQATQVGSNMIALSRQDQEKLTLVGDLQVGQIPTGKSAALRTAGGIQQVLAQGEARPERMLRRFFSGLRQIFENMYRLDRHFLDDEKKFRTIGVQQPDEDPIVTIRRAGDLGDTHFEFGANVLNSSKVALQGALQEMLTIMGNPLMLQVGISTPDSLYRILTDYFKSLGQNSDKYVNAPTPEAKNPPVSAVDALSLILAGQLPQGAPAEGSYEAHLQALMQVLTTPGNDGIPFGQKLAYDERERVMTYSQDIQRRMMEAQQQFAMLQAAQQFQQGQAQAPAAGNGGSGKPPKPQAPMVSGGKEQINESLPQGTGTPQ
jgi:hypothetical protein